MLLAAIIALTLRLPNLDQRPMHNDEAVQAAKTGLLFDAHQYTYDPNEFHGPTLYYFTLPSLWFSGAKTYAESTEFNYRIVPAIFGAGLVLLLLLVRDGMSRTGVFCAAVLAAVSPAMVYFSRYYIQEIPLVFFSFALIACGWRYLHSRKFMWAILTGASAGLMHATKETCVIVFFAVALSAVICVIIERRRRGETPSTVKISVVHAAIALATAAMISILFFSSFFSNARGPLDSILAFGHYFQRSGAPNIHDKPWSYYISMLLWNHTPGAPIWTEALIVVLAAVGAIQAFFRLRNPDPNPHGLFARFMTVYTLAMIVVYSVIAYKTPWCALGILHGLIILAGIGAAWIVESLPHWSLKTIAFCVFAAGASHLAWQAVQANGRYIVDGRNPYVYAHSSVDSVRLCKRIEELAAVHPDGSKMRVNVMVPNSEYWPMPWYLRKFERVGYWNAPPPRLEAPVLVSSNDFERELSLELKPVYQKHQYSLRPGVLVWLYVENDLWTAFLAAQQNGKKK